jgi:hypothetical protein
MITFKEHLLEEYIAEVFDKPYSIKDGEDDMMGFMMKHSAELKGAKNVKVYDIGEEGDKIAAFHYDGALELHHLPASGMQGTMNPEAHKPNPRFVSTAIALGKDHVDKGGKVRIVGTPDVHAAFEPLAKKVSKRLGYNMTSSEMKDTSFYSPFPVKLHQIEISK